MTILKINPDNPETELLQQAANIIINGGVIGYPTETIYGLGADALNKIAVEKIYNLKGREKNKPILILAENIKQVKQLTASFPEAAEILAKELWPGPLTMVFQAAENLSNLLTGDNRTIGIRISDNKICQELLKLCGVPITSTSANISGRLNPVSAVEVESTFGNKLDLIIDGGQNHSRTPSSVVSVLAGSVDVIREGAIPAIKIKKIIERNKMKNSNKFVILFVCSGNACRSPMAEGILKKKLYPLFSDNIKIHSAGTLGIANHPATPNAISVAKEKGVDITGHTSKGITESIVEEADIIFVMADIHRKFLINHFPDFAQKVHLLTNFALEKNEQQNATVKDPIGENLKFYRQVINHIENEIDRIVPELKSLIENKLQ